MLALVIAVLVAPPSVAPPSVPALPAVPPPTPGAVVAAATPHRPALVYVPAGRFTLGSPEEEEGRFDEYERPRGVRIAAPFVMMQTEVTEAQWASILGDAGRPFDRPAAPPDHPAVEVSWFAALHYANGLSAREGLTPCYQLPTGPGGEPGEPRDCTGYRLPTEEEWEYAARAGTRGPRYGPLDAIAWHRDNSGGALHPVAQKQPNAWALYDMLGNASEWTRTRRAAEHGSQTGARIVRGGSFRGYATWLRAAARVGASPDFWADDRGFRLVRGVR